MEEATPPLRIVEGCSVNEINLARGGSINGEGVERRKALPCGIYIIHILSALSIKEEKRKKEGRTVETLAKTEAKKS